ncbi:ABC-three component system protein [uncultured Pseudomonas sp.]|uniref:ABC-three component system protein n=1 Tax=uncultured Pseudomonas sp. TaxID=114707 RepID=UPI002625F537|nr:ABC-three component system protein [uncultured Pseudomonas sp.]
MSTTKKPLAVVFVHGFTGGISTWKNLSGETFKDLLLKEADLSETFEMVEFEYFSKITDIFHADIIQKAISLFGLRPKVRYNRPIKNLADELRSFIQLNLDEHDGIVLIGHSMGGLICKEVILSHVQGDGPEIIGYGSIAVPHKGSLDSILLSLFNVNSKELVPLNAYNSELNNRWIDRKSKLPESVYVIGQHDQYVPQSSGLPFTTKFLNIPHDHNTICKPQSSKDSAYKAIQKFLRKISKNNKMHSLSTLTYEEASPDYDKEIFVIKMILCDIGEKGIEDAKESFFNAEIITKAADEEDKNLLRELRVKVISLYRQTFNYHANTGSTPNMIFGEVHQKLLSEDKHALEVGASYINFLHKKGLLHQEANKECTTVTWSNSTSIEEIKSMLA